MKRTFSMAIIFAVIFTAATAAEGVQEQSQDGNTLSPRPAAPSYSTQEITVSGTLRLTAARPVLESNGEEYTLLYPFHLAEGVEIGPGDTVTVTGYRVPGPRWAWQEQDQRYLRVTIAEVDGREYDLRGVYDAGYGPAQGYGYGHGPGMMGSYGHRRGGGYGHGRGGGMHGGPGYGRQPAPRW